MAENEKLECLKSLQEVLQKKFELENQVENLPANLRAEEAKLKDANSAYLKLTERYNAVNEEVKKKIIGDDKVITHRPADDLKPEFAALKKKYKDIIKSDEDVLSIALFNDVAIKFLQKRKEDEIVETINVSA